MLKENEHLEPLGNNISIIVSKLFHFSTDTILLANFAKPKNKYKAVDLGSGCGTIPLIWARDNSNMEIYGVEIQPQGHLMATRSIELNNLTNVKAINSDLKDLKGTLPFGYFDLVSCNPPYKEGGTGILNPDKENYIARHEGCCTIDDITLTAKNLLQYGGRFCLCQRPERLTDVLSSMRKNDLEPKRLRFVQQRKNKPPKLFLVEGRRGGKPSSLVVEDTLFIEDDNGDFSKEMKEIYGCYKEAYYE